MSGKIFSRSGGIRGTLRCSSGSVFCMVSGDCLFANTLCTNSVLTTATLLYSPTPILNPCGRLCCIGYGPRRPCGDTSRILILSYTGLTQSST